MGLKKNKKIKYHRILFRAGESQEMLREQASACGRAKWLKESMKIKTYSQQTGQTCIRKRMCKSQRASAKTGKVSIFSKQLITLLLYLA